MVLERLRTMGSFSLLEVSRKARPSSPKTKPRYILKSILGVVTIEPIRSSSRCSGITISLLKDTAGNRIGWDAFQVILGCPGGCLPRFHPACEGRTGHGHRCGKRQ
eukprot:Blabericola_migrator_1__1530@NODE_1402_length_4619_cov_95_278559_g584_i1_p4_GENE_NODE_1402_length_4619_cov_95_278559_g584_i1NODE_1402_length_4619_cov_95_278559_g584_i1_p4_ORF_typecomplete_len106_score8_25_NODE_1402_length_4619_cov_95_278559_g584_i139434260